MGAGRREQWGNERALFVMKNSSVNTLDTLRLHCHGGDLLLVNPWAPGATPPSLAMRAFEAVVQDCRCCLAAGQQCPVPLHFGDFGVSVKPPVA